MDRVVLRDARDDRGTRWLEARLEPDGRLVIEGQDLGPGVAAVFGEGLTEYEWRWTVAARDVPAAIAALGAAVGEHAPTVVARWFVAASGATGCDPGSAIREAGVPVEFDSRIGD